MSSVTLDRLWIHTATDLTDVLTLRWASESGALEPNAYVESYTAGAEKIIAIAGSRLVLSFRFPYVSRVDFQDLYDRVDSKVVHLLRDRRSRSYGYLEGLSWDEARHRDVVASVAFTLRRVTFTEVV